MRRFRYQDWRSVTDESSESDIKDCEQVPDGTHTHALHMMKGFGREGFDHRFWLLGWGHEKKLDANDRVVHEMWS